MGGQVGAQETVEVTLQEAGTLSTLITDDQKANLKSLKITGELNGTDLKYIREQLKSTLATLDMTDANIVEGGEAYYSGNINPCGDKCLNKC